MVAPTIDKLVKKKFKEIHKSASSEAETFFSNTHKSALKNKNLAEQIFYIKSEVKKLNEHTAEIAVPFYVENYSNEDWLLRLFSSRTVLLNVDESSELFDAIYTGTVKWKLLDMSRDLEKKIPKYTFKDFLSEKENPFLHDMDFTEHMGEETYYKIKGWQADHLMNFVSIESKMLISIAQEECRKLKDPFAYLNFHNDLFSKELEKKKFSSVSDLITILKKFSFLKNYDFSLLDNEDTLEDLKVFSSDTIDWSKITHSKVAEVNALLRAQKSSGAFSTPPVFFFTLAKVICWMEDVIKGKGLFEPVTDIDYLKLFEKTKAEAEVEAEELNDSHFATNKIQTLPEEEVKSLYFKALDALREEFNAGGNFRYYFQGLNDEKLLPQVFKINCFFSNDIPTCVKELKTAIILQDRMYYFLVALSDMTGSNRVHFPNDDRGSSTEVQFLLHNMVLDADSYRRMRKVMDSFFEDFMRYHLPMELTIRNMNERMRELFDDCIARLLEYLEDCDGTAKVLYVQTRLKQLKQRELTLRELVKDGYEIETGKYTTLFKEYLEIEADYIRDTKDVKVIPAFRLNGGEKRLQLAPPSLSFGYKSADTTSLLSAVKQLCLKIELLDEGRTTAENLVAIFTSKDLKSEQKKVYLKCSTVQFAYLIENLAHHFTALTPTNIGDSELFFSSKGTQLSAQYLFESKRKTKEKPPKQKDEIDKVLKQLQ